jgi:FAD-dependent urate hydroxylase
VTVARETADVAIVGAGPYGLSLAAHLRAAGVDHRVFGEPMRLWRSQMPAGMFLKSAGFASNLSTSQRGHTLEQFCRDTGRPFAPVGRPVPLDTFLAYGDWFQRSQVPHLEEVLVSHVDADNDGYAVSLTDGSSLWARRVVVAAGVQHFAHLPDVLHFLPPELCSHASDHADLSRFAGRDVVVLGAGQSALESAALLHESGAAVRVLARTGKLRWNGPAPPVDRSVWQRLREPEAGLGSGWGNWFYSTRPGLFRYLPRRERLHRARTALGPSGAAWLRPRLENLVPVQLGHAVVGAQPLNDGVRLTARTIDGGRVELRTEHIIASTGYRADLARLEFLDPRLRARIRTIGGTPEVGRTFASSADGLYFVGPAVAPTFGPLMRFVYGADFAARLLSRHLSGSARSRTRLAAGVR